MRTTARFKPGLGLAWSAAAVIFLIRISAEAAAPPATPLLDNRYGQVRLSFEENQGQIDARVNFLARGQGYSLLLSADEARLALKHSTNNPTIRMKLIGADPEAKSAGVDRLAGHVNYFIGSRPERWRTDIPTFARVNFANVYPGVDVVYYGNQRRLEYDFLVAPGADPDAIAIAFEGMDQLKIDQSGDLVLSLFGGEVRFHRPLVYQESDSRKQMIEGRYVLKAQNEVGFELGAYDRSRPLIIDPILVYSSFLGGENLDSGMAIAVDALGNAYVAGTTISSNFPVMNPLPGQETYAADEGTAVGFVTKINPSGTALVYSTYFGGFDGVQMGGIAVDDEGSACITGCTPTGVGFPITNAFQPTFKGGGGDAFVAKLSPTGNRLIYSTFLGGDKRDEGRAIASDREGNAFVTGTTQSSGTVDFSTVPFPTTPGAFQTSYGGTGFGAGNQNGDAFVAKISSSGVLVYSSFLGGQQGDVAYGIAVHGNGNTYVTGGTGSLTDFPVTNAFQSLGGGGFQGDAFVSVLDASGSNLLYSTYLGGNGSSIEQGNGIATDPTGNAYVAGETGSANFPTTPGAIRTNVQIFEAFIAKIDPTQSGSPSLKYSTLIGGSSGDSASGIAVDRDGNAYITGTTSSVNYPTTNAFQPTLDTSTGQDAFVSKLNATGTALVYSSFLGGSKVENGFGIALDGAGNAYITGATTSTNFPATFGVFQSAHGLSSGDGTDAFVARIGEPPLSLFLSGPSAIISWPTNATGFRPKTTTSLSPISWSDVLDIPVVVGGLNQVTLPITNQTQFFRLEK